MLPLFRPYDVDVQVTRLEFGDICWSGKGSTGPELIGVERKTIHDLVSSIRSKRLSGHQLPGLVRTYDWVYLLVEGGWRCGEKGEVQVWVRGGWVVLAVGSRPILYREVDHYLSTLQCVCGVQVERTFDERQTVAWLVSRYKWWTDKEWAQHRSHVQVYAPYEVNDGRHRGSFVRRTPSLAEKVAAQIPGLDRGALQVAKKFKTVERMVEAGVGEWAAVELEQEGKKGRRVVRLGRKRAERIYEDLRRA
mgnify:CR=1 FL=1